MTKKQRKIFYTLIFFIGIILMYFQIEIYRNTFINWKIPASIITIVGILSFLADFKNYKRTYEYSGFELYLYSWMHYIIGFGFIACSIFMLTNFYFAGKEVKTENYEIIGRTTIRGTTKGRTDKEQPVFIIVYKGKSKELVFKNEYFEKMNLYKNVEFETRNGLFGFDILENKKLN
ncbi:RnfABCDGE type electron transport complex subunit D [Polaribacter litorisediminis]|uniref:RnfABCDGE type electron transport complex subunit D n=1 Tax=Polaribacter litorisediminis TaxID=1908341 RepID=UPI001CBC42FF|nr:RnfABCDGE type electron transport complex subunit D [Polaribacter litorisediminis]UAM97807.1 RnfABCDGE type electron transport complex subunit D [Polaribacter litorisediminis]